MRNNILISIIAFALTIFAKEILCSGYHDNNYTTERNNETEEFAVKSPEENTTPSALSRWLWLTLLVGVSGLVLLLGKLIQNAIMIKLLEKAKCMENKDDEIIPESLT
eukprot:GFUD01037999.1.p1 GENE.GFUD01037999.1~~GFUD01037999.1.p1  ORF type:complete len:108 (-),score=25.44 GFUD01037999.1:109-432(-)